jgi:hypothetical protein
MVTQEIIQALIDAGWKYYGVCACADRTHKWIKGGFTLRARVRNGYWQRKQGTRIDGQGTIEQILTNTTI